MLLNGNSRSRRYIVNEEDFSLTIHNATLEDASGAYYCAVQVENMLGNNFYQVGPTFTLEVNSKLLYIHTHHVVPCCGYTVSASELNR